MLLPERFNFRDLGGIETAGSARAAPRRLYRGASLHRLGPEELTRFRGLEVRTVVDLRTEIEWTDAVVPPLAALDARRLPILMELPDLPLDPDDPTAMMVDLYMRALNDGADSILAVLELLADPDSYPLAFYCAAGKDRTGVVAAIVLSVLGVPREGIVRDYTRSDAAVKAQRIWAETDRRLFGPVPASAYRAHASTMSAFLDGVQARYGSTTGYLREIGVTAAVEAEIGANLLEG